MKLSTYSASILTLGIAMALTGPACAQKKLPVIKSGIPVISIRDGKTLTNNTWHLDPKSKPDTYFVQVPEGKRKITFITDRESISFVPLYGKSYDFIVLLNGKDSCLTRITAAYQDIIKAVNIKKGQSMLADTIPFFMRGSRIYFKGKLNGNTPFDIMFDLGAGITCLNALSVPRSGAKFDGKTRVQNTSGIKDEPTASNNTLEIGNLKWNKVPLVKVSNVDEDDDMIIGNSLFRNKVIELDYDKKIMIISNYLQKNISGYSKHDLNYYQQRPLFAMDVTVNDQYYPFYFLFDTGRDGTMLIGEDFTEKYGLWNKYQSILTLGSKKIVVIPEVRIGSKSFYNIVTNANDPSHPNGKQSLMGNEVLNQFNVILDNRNGTIYLKPNNHQNENYATYGKFKLQAGLVIIAFVLTLTLLVWGIKFWLKRIKTFTAIIK